MGYWSTYIKNKFPFKGMCFIEWIFIVINKNSFWNSNCLLSHLLNPLKLLWRLCNEMSWSSCCYSSQFIDSRMSKCLKSNPYFCFSYWWVWYLWNFCDLIPWEFCKPMIELNFVVNVYPIKKTIIFLVAISLCLCESIWHLLFLLFILICSLTIFTEFSEICRLSTKRTNFFK